MNGARLRVVRLLQISLSLSSFAVLSVASTDEAVQQAAPAFGTQLHNLADKTLNALPDNTVNERILVEDGSGGKLAEIQMEISSGIVLLMTLLMAGAAGLGTVPFFFTGKLSKEVAALASAVACGVMIACSFDLIHEGQPYGGNLVIAGVILGAIFISTSQQWLEQFEDVRFQGLQGISARKILLMIGIMAAHAFGEGAGVGVSFCGSRGWAQGVLVTIAIGLHNIPEGLAVSTVLVARGISPRSALLWTLFTAMPQPLVAVPSFLFVDAFRVLLPLALGFAAGCMVWMVFAELLPDALADAPHGKVATVGTFSAASLEGLRMLLSGLERGEGRIALPVALNTDNLATCASLLLPAAVCGGLIAFIARSLPKERASTLGLCAGLLTWQGMASLATALTPFQTARLVPLLLSLIPGSAGVVFLKFVVKLQSQESGKQKEKVGDTPKKSRDESVVVARQEHINGHSKDALLEDLESGRGGITRVFEPYKKEDNGQGALIAALAASVLISISQGVRMAQVQSSEPFNTVSWIGIALRACSPGAVGTLLFQRRCSGKALVVLAAATASMTPLASACMRIHMQLGGPTVKSLDFFPLGTASGAGLTAGLWILWPLSRHIAWQAGSWGVVKGLTLGALISSLLRLLCWQFSHC